MAVICSDAFLHGFEATMVTGPRDHGSDRGDCNGAAGARMRRVDAAAAGRRSVGVGGVRVVGEHLENWPLAPRRRRGWPARRPPSRSRSTPPPLGRRLIAAATAPRCIRQAVEPQLAAQRRVPPVFDLVVGAAGEGLGDVGPFVAHALVRGEERLVLLSVHCPC